MCIHTDADMDININISWLKEKLKMNNDYSNNMFQKVLPNLEEHYSLLLKGYQKFTAYTGAGQQPPSRSICLGSNCLFGVCAVL